MDHTALTLVQATREQIIISKKRHARHWGVGISEDQWVTHEDQVEKLEHASDGKMIAWVLVPKNDTTTLDFYCSCETFCRTALRVKPFSAEPEQVTAYCVAFVFCAPEYRRKGYASHMMRLLHHILAPPSVFPPHSESHVASPPPGIGGDALFSVLYSDVGEFYTKCGPAPHKNGWEIRGAVSTYWPITLPPDPVDPPSKLLTLEECQKLWETDSQYIYDTLKHHHAESGVTRIAFQPKAGIATLPVVRTALFSQSSTQLPEYWGVTFYEETAPTYATWTLFKRVLIVTRLRAVPSTLPALVRALAGAARMIGATAVETWALPLELREVAARLGATTKERKVSLPAIAWYGPEDPDTVEWLFNEKFAWC